jgi:hypothetical protein
VCKLGLNRAQGLQASQIIDILISNQALTTFVTGWNVFLEQLALGLLFKQLFLWFALQVQWFVATWQRVS